MSTSSSELVSVSPEVSSSPLVLPLAPYLLLRLTVSPVTVPAPRLVPDISDLVPESPAETRLLLLAELRPLLSAVSGVGDPEAILYLGS